MNFKPILSLTLVLATGTLVYVFYEGGSEKANIPKAPPFAMAQPQGKALPDEVSLVNLQRNVVSPPAPKSISTQGTQEIVPSADDSASPSTTNTKLNNASLVQNSSQRSPAPHQYIPQVVNPPRYNNGSQQKLQPTPIPISEIVEKRRKLAEGQRLYPKVVY